MLPPKFFSTGLLILATVSTAAGLTSRVLALDDPPSEPTGELADSSLVTEGASTVGDQVSTVDSATLPPPDGRTTSPEAGEVTAVQTGEPGEAVTAQAGTASTPGSGQAGPASEAVAQSGASSAPSAATSPTQTAPRTTRTTTRTPATTARPTRSSPNSSSGVKTTYETVEISGRGEVVVAIHEPATGSPTLEFWSAKPEPGWAYLLEDRSSTSFKIKFRPKSGGDEDEIRFRLRDGQLEIDRDD